MTDPLPTAGCLLPTAHYESPAACCSRKFVLIDHSITDTGGHHLEYALRVLQSAERQGFEPVLATNRKLRGGEELQWRVLPVYRYGFWFQTAPPRVVALVQRAWQGVQRRAFLWGCRWHFSSWGILWSRRQAPREILGESPSVRQMALAAAVLAAVIYPTRVAKSLGRLLAAALPIGGYLRSVSRAGRELLTTIAWPVRAASKRWPAISRRAFAWRKQAAFAADSLRLFRQVKLAEGDIVFIPTLAEPEMLGLLKLFAREPLSAAATWHLLFRRDIYSGRDPDYASQDERQRPLRNAFQRFLAGLSGQRVHFYTDTERLTDQYNRLGVATFRTAPIPVAADYRPTSMEDGLPRPSRNKNVGWAPPTKEHLRALPTNALGANGGVNNERDGLGRPSSPDAPAHIVYIGDARTEKGYHHLPRLVADLAADGPPALFTFQSNFNIPGGEPAPAVARAQLAALPPDQVRLVTEPMDSEEYRRLLLEADVVLIPYDRNNYYARSSGVFAEALVAGKPVVVPAGTWMATELAPAIATCHRAARERCRVLDRFGPGAVRWRTREDSRLRTVPDAPVPVYGESPSYCSLFVPAGATHLHVTFRLPGGGRGIFPGLALEQFGPAGSVAFRSANHATRHTPRATHHTPHATQHSPLGTHYTPPATRHTCLSRDVSIVGGTEECSALLPLQSDARRVRLKISNALSPLALELEDVRVEFLAASEPLPLSAVGTIYSEPGELASHVREILIHRDHYQSSALHFSRAWGDYHSPDRLASQLTQADTPGPSALTIAARTAA